MQLEIFQKFQVLAEQCVSPQSKKNIESVLSKEQRPSSHKMEVHITHFATPSTPTTIGPAPSPRFQPNPNQAQIAKPTTYIRFGQTGGANWEQQKKRTFSLVPTLIEQ